MQLEDLTALYSPLDIEISQSMSGPYEDMSLRTDKCTVIAGVKQGHITGFWRPVVAAGDEKLALGYIQDLYADCPSMAYLDFLTNGNLSPVSRFLLSKGYTAKPQFTQILPLTDFEGVLKSGLRKSYRSLVNKKGAAVIDDGDWRNYVDSIRVASDAPLHPEIDIQWEMDEKKQAFCVCDNGCYVLVYYNSVWAYYASGRAMKGSKMHAALWVAIMEARRRGCMFFELGQQVFGKGKAANISKFKRGFGGFTKTRMLLEKEKDE